MTRRIAFWLSALFYRAAARLENYARIRFVFIRYPNGKKGASLRLAHTPDDRGLRYVRDAGSWSIIAHRQGDKLTATDPFGVEVTLVPTSYARWLADNEPCVQRWLKDLLTGVKS